MIASPAMLLAAVLLIQEAPSIDEWEPAQETAHVDEDGKFGWSCWVPVKIGPYAGKVSRAYYRKRKSVYTMQVELPGYGDRHPLIWTVDPGPQVPAPGTEANAFRFGPGSVGLELEMDAEVVGALWIQYWGDGVHAGTDLRFTPRQVRRWVGKGRQKVGIGANVSPAVIAKLASARRWTAVLTDSTGRRLATKVFEVPSPEEAEAVFRKARAAIDALEPRFGLDHSPRSEAGAHCSDFDDPQSIAEI